MQWAELHDNLPNGILKSKIDSGLPNKYKGKKKIKFYAFLEKYGSKILKKVNNILCNDCFTLNEIPYISCIYNIN